MTSADYFGRTMVANLLEGSRVGVINVSVAGSNNIPVTNAAGFEVGQKISIDPGGNYEVATVTNVGKASSQTTLAVPAKAGDVTIKVTANSNMAVSDTLIIDTGVLKERAVVKSLINVVSAPARGGSVMGGTNFGEVELTAPLKSDHMLSVDISDRGTGISFSPATRFAHKSGDAVQALGSGITFASPLRMAHKIGSQVACNAPTPGEPNQYFRKP